MRGSMNQRSNLESLDWTPDRGSVGPANGVPTLLSPKRALVDRTIGDACAVETIGLVS